MTEEEREYIKRHMENVRKGKKVSESAGKEYGRLLRKESRERNIRDLLKFVGIAAVIGTVPGLVYGWTVLSLVKYVLICVVFILVGGGLIHLANTK